MLNKIKEFAELVQKDQRDRLIKSGLGCEVNIQNATTKIKEGKKYTKVDIGGSGKFMVDSDGNIFGIKGYGVIHKGHKYGNLDTINNYYWGNYNPVLKQQ